MPSLSRMFGRALTLRCPWCASRRSFVRRWIGRHPRCRTCGLRWRREDGFELGPMTLNIIVTFIVVLITMGVLVALTLPDIPVVRVVLVLVGVAVTVPIVLFPFCNLAWFAVDLRAHPPSAGELGEASAAISEKSATHP